MQTAQEMRTVMKNAQEELKQTSQKNAPYAVEKFILPKMFERAKNGYGCVEIELDNIFTDQALNAYGIHWVEHSGGWTRTKTTNYLVYIDDIVAYLKTQGYVAHYTRWIKTLTLTVDWKGGEE